jgi:glucan biosynthesis protein C
VLTTGLLLLAYDLMVRSTWIGRWLNGHRRLRTIFTRRAGERLSP